MSKKILINSFIFFIILIINTTVLAAGIGHCTALPPNAAIEGVGGGLVCVQSGTSLRTKGSDYDTLNDAPETYGWTEDGDYATNYGTKKSKTYFNSASSMAGSKALWYIAANAGSQDVLQVAVWGTIGGGIPGSRSWMSSEEISSGVNLIAEANAAAAFVSAGFNIVDKTNYQNITIKQEGGNLVVGPYRIEYNDGCGASKNFSNVTGQYITDKSGNKIKDVSVIGGIYSNQDFYITYEPHDAEGNLITYAKLKIDFTYLSDLDGSATKYEGVNLEVSYSKSDEDYQGLCTDSKCGKKHYTKGENKYHKKVYEFKKNKNETPGQPLAKITGSEVWSSKSFESNVPDLLKFDLSLKKFITKVGDTDVSPRLTVQDTSKLYQGVSDNAIYNKIYSPYRVKKDKNITYTIRIYNEGDIEGRAEEIKDYLPEGVSYKVIDSAGYNVSFDEANREITFSATADVQNLAPFTGGTLAYTDIIIECTIDDIVYESIGEKEKIYDVSIEEYIEAEGTKVKEVKTGDEITYILKVKNKGDDKVYLKEIRQTLPKGIEFVEGESWNTIPNSDGSTVCSKIICEDIENEKEYRIKCKVTGKEGTLRAVSEIVSTAQIDADKSDWKDYAKVQIKNDEINYVDLSLDQVISEVNGETKNEKEIYNLKKGDVVKYKITVKNEGTKNAEEIKISNYIPDGMRFIPRVDSEEYNELEEIVEHKDAYQEANTINQKWDCNENLNSAIYTENVGIDDPIYIMCVITEEGSFTNISEIIKYKDEESNIDIDSTPNNVKLDEYGYESQEDDDSYTIVSTESTDNKSDLKITIEGTTQTDNLVNYKICIENKGSSDAKVNIKDILEGMECTKIDGVDVNEGNYDSANRIIKIIDKTINSGNTVEIPVKCKITEENEVIELIRGETLSSEEKEEHKKIIKHTAYISKSDIYDETKSDWKAQEEIKILEVKEEVFTAQEMDGVTGYEEYLTNTAMITKTSGNDRDAGDWKDSDTIIVEDNNNDDDSITVKKIWRDNNDSAGKRPKKVRVYLMQGASNVAEIELSAENNWKHTFEGLDKSKEYSIKEEAVTNYDTEITKKGKVYNIINYYNDDDGGPGKKEVTVNKVWDDENDKYGLRPSSITVNLLDEDGNTIRTTELSESNSWEHTFKGLKDGINYTVDEEYVSHYTKSISGYTITNTYRRNPPIIETPTPGPNLPVGVPVTMEIAGNVFEDLASTKGGEADNVLGIEDGALSGVEVTLYEKDDDDYTLARIYQQYEENPNIPVEEAEIRTNPTITDQYGNYIFKGLDTTKKYKVKFRYNGLVYEPVQCNDTVEYNSEEWSKTSKSIDDESSRSNLNNVFSEIRSYPDNYKKVNDIGLGIGEYNKIYLETDLEKNRIYDGCNIYEIITKKIQEYINNNKTYPNNINSIYTEINNNYFSIDSEIANKLQFVEDCKVEACSNRVYPYYDTFVVDDSKRSITVSSDSRRRYKLEFISNPDDIPDLIGYYEQINSELQKIVDKVSGLYSGFNYNLDWYFTIHDGSGAIADEVETFAGYAFNVYKSEIIEDASGEPKIEVTPDIDILKNQLAWSLNISNGINFGEAYNEKVNQIFEIFNNNDSEIKEILNNIVSKVQKYYEDNAIIIKLSSEEPEKPDGTYNDINNIYPGQLYINLGLKKREEFDLTIAKDVYKVDLSINGYNMTYYYNNVDIDSYTGDWITEVRASDTFYERNIYASDYHYCETSEPNNKLDIKVTYRIALRNQTLGIIGEVTEIVDYFDSEYEYVSASTYLGNGKGEKIVDLKCSTDSIYGNKAYDNLKSAYITNNGSGIEVKNGEDKYIYITFKVNNDSHIIEDGQINLEGLKELKGSKQNIVEINGYKTYYEGNTTAYNGTNKAADTPAGVLDKDSVPGNYEPNKHYDIENQKYYADEDDVAVANGLYILVDYYNERTIAGTVWEDSAISGLLEQKIRQGNGEYEEGEKLVQNVRATLMKYQDGNEYKTENVAYYYKVIDSETDASGKTIYKGEWILAEIYTDDMGEYLLTGFVPGEYDVWFTYDNYSINIDIDEESYNETRYNGQDYKSTIYNEIDTTGLEEQAYWYSIKENKKSDAKDIWTRREEVNNYSKVLTNDIAESLVPTDLAKYNTGNTTMYAKTNKMKMNVEYLKTSSQSISNITENKGEGQKELNAKDDYSKYIIQNIDFGLVERPRAQLSIQKNVANVKVILSDGNVLFDALPDENGKFKYTNLGSIPRKLATAYVETIGEKLKNSTHVSTEQGRITMNMDEELMQGANLQVTYEISVDNIGEIDYNNEVFYNKGYKVEYETNGEIKSVIPSDDDNLVTTKVDQIIDYVENNMAFAKTLNRDESKPINQGWEVKDKDDIGTTKDKEVVLKDTVIEKLFNGTDTTTDDEYNTIAVLTGNAKAKSTANKAISEELKPGEVAKSDFILTQLISPENKNDDLTYKNVLEIVKTTNDVGRRMYFSIAGNHVPVKREGNDIIETSVRPEGREIDTDDGELITIIPPFGANKQQNSQIAVFGIALVAFFGAGVYLIKKKVLK